MTPIKALKERFDRDSLSLKWGSVASDLLRLSSMAGAPKPQCETIQGVLTETKHFTEWLAPQVDLEKQKTILSLQRVLVQLSSKASSFKEFKATTLRWSDKILRISGLM